ncbi:uncharacterized protein LOC110455849 [Mizuhopecten yessoensis]|uniref:Acyl-ACP thioesterase-like C-terminal domain-containing protein n=1 Tax=Mizuhopecten yessoensis TaxID=6573 RepID=A0A210QC89_MIZYE|nr:uncharacterized protein LOC110455849 [Mizuhopecten yessoensis]OWF46352.1 hypothetical protein KP79_PYT04825 [Mizuhopecten yessoensis]
MAHYTLTHASPGRCEFDMASPTSAFRDRTGHLSMWSISKIYHDAATIAIDHGFMPSSRDLGKDNIRLFLISEKYVMSPTFRTKFSRAGKLQKYHVTYTVSAVTPGSVSNRRVFSDTDTGSWFLKSEIKLVAVNWETRRSAKFPDSYYESLSKLVDHEHASIMTRKQDTLIPPDTAFKTTFQTRYSDLDFNLHVNVAEYYRFCSDATSEASLSGYYRHFTSDIVKYTIMQTDATFLSECGPREQIVVYTWQDEDNFTKLYFAIYLKKVRIFQSCFIYNSSLTQDKVMSSL